MEYSRMEGEREGLGNCTLVLVDIISGVWQGEWNDKFWKVQIINRGIPEKRSDHTPRNKRLQEKKLDQCLVY